MDVYRDESIVITYHIGLKRYGISAASNFISATATTFKILLSLLDMREDAEVMIRQEKSSIQISIHDDGALIRFMNFRSKNHQARVYLNRKCIARLISRKCILMEASSHCEYFTKQDDCNRAIVNWKEMR